MKLTELQRGAAECVLQGMTDAQICLALGCAEGAARGRVESLKRRLGVRTRKELRRKLQILGVDIEVVNVQALQTKRQSFRLEALRLLLENAGVQGMGLRELTVKSGYNYNTLSNYLRMLRDKGQAEKSDPTGAAVRWGPPGTWKHHEARRVKAAAIMEKRKQREALMPPKPKPEPEGADAGWVQVRRLVSVGKAKPLQKRGPASVFEVGAYS